MTCKTREKVVAGAELSPSRFNINPFEAKSYKRQTKDERDRSRRQSDLQSVTDAGMITDFTEASHLHSPLFRLAISALRADV
jgi:hypothetical protein